MTILGTIPRIVKGASNAAPVATESAVSLKRAEKMYELKTGLKLPVEFQRKLDEIDNKGGWGVQLKQRYFQTVSKDVQQAGIPLSPEDLKAKFRGEATHSTRYSFSFFDPFRSPGEARERAGVHAGTPLAAAERANAYGSTRKKKVATFAERQRQLGKGAAEMRHHPDPNIVQEFPSVRLLNLVYRNDKPLDVDIKGHPEWWAPPPSVADTYKDGQTVLTEGQLSRVMHNINKSDDFAAWLKTKHPEVIEDIILANASNIRYEVAESMEDLVTIKQFQAKAAAELNDPSTPRHLRPYFQMILKDHTDTIKGLETEIQTGQRFMEDLHDLWKNKDYDTYLKKYANAPYGTPESGWSNIWETGKQPWIGLYLNERYGYTHVKYINEVEDQGSTSVVVLAPHKNLRRVDAAFKKGAGSLTAGVAGWSTFNGKEEEGIE